MSNWLSQKIRDTANKAKGALKQAIKPQYSAEEIQKILKEADRKEDEFNSEKGTIDVHLANGEALNSLINESSRKGSVQSKYKAYLEKKIKESREHIKDFKNDDKFYRREFLENNPLINLGQPFWKNWDNWILLAIWSAVVAILVPTSLAVFGLPLSGNQQMALILSMWLVFPLFLLYLIQNFA
jgi:hypothetical protein